MAVLVIATSSCVPIRPSFLPCLQVTMVQPWVNPSLAAPWIITYKDPAVGGTGWGAWEMAGDLDADFPLKTDERPAVMYMRAVDPSSNGV
jgi:hypothetical protein